MPDSYDVVIIGSGQASNLLATALADATVMPVTTSGWARETGRMGGCLKVMVDAKDQIIGAAILCAKGCEIRTMLQLSMTGKLKYQVLQQMIFAHPLWIDSLNNAFAKLEKPKKRYV
jgi:pyruvate/2-oxoglutarate dehydrogenase complex dihydrolipoamide dehydrogenase (E3) component